MFSKSISSVRRLTTALAAVAVLGAVTVAGVPGAMEVAAANPSGPIVIPPGGSKYDSLSVAWWKYALEQPNVTNPLLDPTGAGCRIGQSGHVFFLVGTENTGQAARDDCTVPLGEQLYFPLVNAFDVHTPGDGLDTPELVWHDLQVTYGFRVDSLFATVDGMPVANLDPATSPYRACAGPSAGCVPSFTFNFAASNLFGLAAGPYQPAVADGFYLLLPPLTPGPHTVTFGGSGNLGGQFTQSAVYHLTVGN
jgi:hypothetical protein